jgi:uncharacterized protein
LIEIAQINPENSDGKPVIIFDEIQYLRDWEFHLKDLVDSFPNAKFIASGSAAAALRLKSNESGAGRFTDFYLPPLSFSEFVSFRGHDNKFINVTGGITPETLLDIHGLNTQFIDYINLGGFPEIIFSREVADDLERFVRNDIVDKILLKDLPNLYGIDDVQELNRLFTVLAYNDGQEISLEALSSDAQVSKPTIRRYIKYLESAYLVSVVDKVDINAKRFIRQKQQKIYLTNPCMRAALFGPVDSIDSKRIGHLAEAACFAQLIHGRWTGTFHYARTSSGEVDIVFLSKANQKPKWAREIKWSDRAIDSVNVRKECGEIFEFCKRHSLNHAIITTKTRFGFIDADGINIEFIPTSVYCYRVSQVGASRMHLDIDL